MEERDFGAGGDGGYRGVGESAFSADRKELLDALRHICDHSYAVTSDCFLCYQAGERKEAQPICCRHLDQGGIVKFRNQPR